MNPPKIYKHRRLVKFVATLTYTGEVMLNDCDDSQVYDRISEAIGNFVMKDAYNYKTIEHDILTVSNEDLTSNDYPQ